MPLCSALLMLSLPTPKILCASDWHTCTLRTSLWRTSFNDFDRIPFLRVVLLDVTISVVQRHCSHQIKNKINPSPYAAIRIRYTRNRTGRLRNIAGCDVCRIDSPVFVSPPFDFFLARVKGAISEASWETVGPLQNRLIPMDEPSTSTIESGGTFPSSRAAEILALLYGLVFLPFGSTTRYRVGSVMGKGMGGALPLYFIEIVCRWQVGTVGRGPSFQHRRVRCADRYCGPRQTIGTPTSRSDLRVALCDLHRS